MKELNFTFYEGHPGTVTYISIDSLNNLLSRTDPADNQRRTENYHIIADDNFLQGV